MINTLKLLYGELRRRRVHRVAAVYAVVGWLLIQVADTVFPALAMPDWTLRLVILLVALGFPLAITLAWAFDITPDGVQRTAPAEPAAGSHGTSAPAFMARRSVWFVVGVLVAFSAAWIVIDDGAPRSETPGLEAGAVAVLPFRVAGAAPELAYLREGLVDLLTTKLTGEIGPRALDPRRVITAWRGRLPSDAGDLAVDSALALARDLQAGQLLTGTIVGTPRHMIITAWLHDAASGRERARVTTEGSPDSLTAIVDRLAGELLALEAGAQQSDLASFTSHSLSALQEYLKGQASYRQGRYDESCEAFRRALDYDSTFALAGLGISMSAGWLPTCDDAGADGIIWGHRDRLSARDRAFAVAWLGSRHPEPTPYAQQVEDWRGAVEAMPDRADVWFHLADRIYHHGALLGMEEWRERSADLFRRALALDSANAENYIHLVPLLGRLGRDDEAVALGERFLAGDRAGGETADFLRWRVARARRDTAAIARIRERFAGFTTLALAYVASVSVLDNVGIEDGELALEAWSRQPPTPSGRRLYLLVAYLYEIARGRPGAAVPLGREHATVVTGSNSPIHLQVVAALYGDGDEDAAHAAVRELARTAEAAPFEDAAERAAQLRDLCTVTQWRLWRGEPARAEQAVRALRDGAAASSFAPGGEACAALIEAIAAAVRKTPDATARATELDALLEIGPVPEFDWESTIFNFAAARIHELNGDPERALAAVRRRPSFSGGTSLLLAEALLLEGDLAARLGRRDEAIESYRHYLALRAHPEPALEDEVEHVRAELAALVRREGGDG